MMRAYCFILLSLTTLLSVSAEEQVFCSDSNIYCVNPALHLKPLLVEHEKRLLPMLPLNAYYNDSLVVVELLGDIGRAQLIITDLDTRTTISKPLVYTIHPDSVVSQRFQYESIRLISNPRSCLLQIKTENGDIFSADFGNEDYNLLDPPM
ncbi:MAG: hypothetical protein IIX13_07720 [Bacteroidales bacterium]|nr:hypothetical protein [Bacteroidales bacterium]